VCGDVYAASVHGLYNACVAMSMQQVAMVFITRVWDVYAASGYGLYNACVAMSMQQAATVSITHVW